MLHYQTCVQENMLFFEALNSINAALRNCLIKVGVSLYMFGAHLCWATVFF